MQRFFSLLPLVIILLLSLTASQKLFTDKFYTSHDGEGHVIRMIEFDHALKDGQIPVRIAKHINHGLGYPFFNFNYPIIYYMGQAMHLLGFSYVASFKILLFFSVLAGGVGMYYFSKRHFDTLSALISAVLYIIVPYRFLNMYVRGNVAESIGLALLPFFFLSIDLLVAQKKQKYLFFGILLALLLLSHNITAMLTLAYGGCYFLIALRKSNDKKSILMHTGTWVLIALLLTAFFWVPVIFESRLTRLSELMTDYKDFFPTLGEVIYSPWGFGAYKSGVSLGKMSPQIGIVHEGIFLLASMLFFIQAVRKKLHKNDFFFLYFIGMFFVSLFLLLPFSKYLWDVFPPLQLVQLPWRFLGYIVFASAIAAGYSISKIKPQKYKILCMILITGLLLYTNRNHIRVNQYVSFYTPFAENTPYGPSTTSRDEHMPLWAPRVYTNPVQNGEVFPPDAGKSKRIVWRSNHHVFMVQTTKTAQFRDNTSYYPGWIAKIDGSQTDILYKKDAYGRLLITVPKGKHTVEFFFKETSYRLLADMISVISFIGLLFWLLKKRHTSRKNTINLP